MAKDINPNPRTPFVGQRGELSKYGMDIILKLYRTLRFSGNDSIVDTIDTDLTQVNNDIDDLESAQTGQATQIASLQAEVALIGDYPLTPVTVDLTTSTRAFLNVTVSGVVVTLNPSPADGEQVIVHLNTGSSGSYVDVTDGTGTDRITLDQTVLSYRYSDTLSQWIRGG